MKRRLTQLALGFGLAILPTLLFAQGPSSAQIQSALRAFLTQAHTWTATQTFADIVVGGSCTGCGGGGSSAFDAITSGTNTTAAMVIGTGATLSATGSGAITATAAPLAGLTGLGTGVGTALGINVGSAGAPVLFNGALGTPSSGSAANLTSIPVNQAIGDLPFANLTQIAGLSVLGVTGSSTADVAAITAGTDGQVLTRVSSSSLAFATPAMVKIEEQTPTGTGTVTFSSLGAFTHLKIMWSARGDQSATNTNMNLQFNGDTGSNYDRQSVAGSGSTASAVESLGATSALVAGVAAASAPSGAAGVGELIILDYRGTTFQKGVVVNQGRVTATSSGGLTTAQHLLNWRSSAAITSVVLSLASGNFVSGSKFTLYGLN